MKETIKLGYVGIGRRGSNMLERCFARMPDVEITWVCEKIPERLEKGVKILAEAGRPAPRVTHNYADLLADPELDGIVLMTGWSSRAGLAEQALLAGKYTAVEVGCADTLEECFRLVAAGEKTGAPLMMLENCCYNRREMMLLNMVRQGLFGELVHCTGAYAHYLNEVELFLDIDGDGASHYRLPHYQARCRENYPTHALGPLSKIMSLNRGNRMARLSSFASKARGLQTYAAAHLGADSPYANMEYKQGDIVTTVITCENGETIRLTLDTTLPRGYYCRDISVRGTKGASSEERLQVYLAGEPEGVWQNEEEFYEKYDHPLWAEYRAIGERGGHDGMDWLVCRAFVESVKAGVNTPIDLYDTVSWMAVGCLSEQSIARGGAPVEFPDFTGGKWRDREPIVEGKYCLDAVCVDEAVKIAED